MATERTGKTGGLILERQIGESIMIGENIEVEAYAYRHGGVKLRIIAPKDVVVDRKEVYVAKQLEKRRIGAKSLQDGAVVSAAGS